MVSQVMMSMLKAGAKYSTPRQQFSRPLTPRQPLWAVRAVPETVVEAENDPEITAYQKHQETAARISAPEEVRTLLQTNKMATLCTISSASATKGFPFAASVSYAVDDQGRAIASLSSMSSHTKDLRADDRCSLHIVDTGFEGMADARCCITGRFVEVVDASERDACKAIYKKAHPDHFWVDFGDFAYFRMDDVLSARLVAGFGRATTVQSKQFWEARPDPVAAFSVPVCGHMNKDHGDATIAMIKHYVGITVSNARMLSLDRLGLNIEATRNGEKFKIRLPFDEPAEDRKSIKDHIVAMTKAAASTA